VQSTARFVEGQTDSRLQGAEHRDNTTHYMANTYTQLYVHIIFSVKGRESLIKKLWKDRLYAYIGGIISNRKSKPLAINGMSDHIHIFIGYNPTTPLPDLVEEIKTSSNKFIKENFELKTFAWQKGYGAFTYSRSQIDAVINYIAKQEEHHKTKTFKEEYIKMLKDFEVEYEDNYLFDFQEIGEWID
jgi:putative transposase